MDVLNDLLIAFLAQPSALLRDVTERTFKGVSGKITDRGIEDILNVVENMGAEKRGDDDDEEDDDDSDDEDMLEEEDDSDDDSSSSDTRTTKMTKTLTMAWTRKPTKMQLKPFVKLR